MREEIDSFTALKQLIHSTVGKRAKRMPGTTVETTVFGANIGK